MYDASTRPLDNEPYHIYERSPISSHHRLSCDNMVWKAQIDCQRYVFDLDSELWIPTWLIKPYLPTCEFRT